MKRSSRRRQVQEKRKRLGLTVSGKLAPFVYTTLMGRKLCKPTRRECLEAALHADRLIRTYPEWLNPDEPLAACRQRLIKNWLRWQTRCHKEEVKRPTRD